MNNSVNFELNKEIQIKGHLQFRWVVPVPFYRNFSVSNVE